MESSRWRHNICVECWRKQKGPDCEPVRPANPDPVDDLDACCFCGKRNTDRIYVRRDPDSLACKGLHPNYK